MDAILAQISHLHEQARTQAASIAQLSSIVARQTTQLESHGSTIARLSSENSSLRSLIALLKRTNEDQDKLNGEVTRASIPGGFWVWESRREEGREDEGRWLWSLEKYRVFPPPSVAAGPPTSLLSLPVELLDLILDLLEEDEHLALCLVCLRLLELASEHVYGDMIDLDPDEAYDFVESRVFNQTSQCERITSLLLPMELRLRGLPDGANAFTGLDLLASSLSSPSSPLRVKCLGVVTLNPEDLVLWTDLLSFLDPVTFELWVGEDNEIIRPPTIRFVPANFVDTFVSDWSRLREFSALGPESVLLVEGSKSTSAFEACLRRCSPDFTLVRVEFWTRASEGAETSITAKEETLPEFLETLQDFEEGFQLVWLRFVMGKAKKSVAKKRKLSSSSP